jgi:hypothetical protein
MDSPFAAGFVGGGVTLASLGLRLAFSIGKSNENND